MPASSCSTTLSLPLRKGRSSIGTSNWNSVLPSCGSLRFEVAANLTSLPTSSGWMRCARTSVRARRVSSAKEIVPSLLVVVLMRS